MYTDLLKDMEYKKTLLASYVLEFQGSIAKKPYNPIIGETFHCSWDLPSSSDQSNGAPENSRVTFVAEQVSHHPPGE